MSTMDEVPACRNLDGMFFRVIRDGRHVSCCFSDLTESEQGRIMAEYNAEQLRRLCRCLCSSLRQIGDTLDLVLDE